MSPSRFSRYLFIAGLFLFLAIYGFIPALYNTSWALLGALGLSVASAIAWFFFSLDAIVAWWKRRSTQWAVSLGIIAVAVFLGLIAVNFAANMYNVKKDVTQTKFNSLSEQSLNIAGKLKEEITVRVWSTNLEKMSPNVDLRRFLENYRIAGHGKIKVEFLNPYENRPEAERDNVKRDNMILIRAASGREARIENYSDGRSEELVTNGLMQAIHGGTKKTVCFTTGHGESPLNGSGADGLSQLKQQLENSSYKVDELALANLEGDKIPADRSLVVVAGPKSDPVEREWTMLKDYLSSGGKMIGLFGVATSEKWRELGSEFGVHVRADLVIDPRQKPPVVVATRNFANDVEFVKIDRFMVFPEASSIDVKAPTAGVETKTFVSSENLAYSKTGNLRALKNLSQSGGDLKGPLPMGVIITKPIAAAPSKDPPIAPAPGSKEEPKKPAESKTGWLDLIPSAHAQDGHDHGEDEGDEHGEAAEPAKEGPKDQKNEMSLILYANHHFVTNSFLSLGGNSDVFLNSVNFVLKDQELMGIRPREIRQTQLQLSRERIRQVFAAIFLMALVFLVGGVSAAFRRAT